MRLKDEIFEKLNSSEGDTYEDYLQTVQELTLFERRFDLLKQRYKSTLNQVKQKPFSRDLEINILFVEECFRIEYELLKSFKTQLTTGYPNINLKFEVIHLILINEKQCSNEKYKFVNPLINFFYSQDKTLESLDSIIISHIELFEGLESFGKYLTLDLNLNIHTFLNRIKAHESRIFDYAKSTIKNIITKLNHLIRFIKANKSEHMLQGIINQLNNYLIFATEFELNLRIISQSENSVSHYNKYNNIITEIFKLKNRIDLFCNKSFKEIIYEIKIKEAQNTLSTEDILTLIQLGFYFQSVISSKYFDSLKTTFIEYLKP